MLKPALISFTGIATFLFANFVAALGLGELKLLSTLNEPFHAEIRLQDVGNLNEEEIIITLASQEEFARNNLERHYFYNEFVFAVELNGNDAKVTITSHSVVREPFLDFIIETRWPTGRVQREYTVLLDKPAALAND